MWRSPTRPALASALLRTRPMLIPLAVRRSTRLCVSATLALFMLCACAPDGDVAPPTATSIGPARSAPSEGDQSDDSVLASALVYGARQLKRNEHEKAAELLEAAGIGIIVTHGLGGHLIWVRPADEDRARAILLANDETKAGVAQPKTK